MASFSPPVVHVNALGWGPSAENVPEQFKNLPFAPFCKGDLGKGFRVADFTAQAAYNARLFKQYRQRSDDPVVNADLQYKHDSTEDQTFSLVDSSKAGGPKKFGVGGQRRWGKGKGKGWGSHGKGKGGRGGDGGRGGGRGQEQQLRRRNDPGGNFRRLHKGGKGQRRFNNRVDSQASVKVGVEWKVVEEFDLPQFNKLQTNPPKVEDIKWCGHLEEYDEAYDSVSTRTAKPLVRCETKEFYNVTTTDDPVIAELAAQSSGNVYATDAVLAHLMACPRSVNPWDLVVQKFDNGGEPTVFFDKRDDSKFDFLTVSETASDPPMPSDDPEAMNSPENLSVEATSINQNFTQQILHGSKRQDMEHPNPFFDPEDEGGLEPAAVAYRYRKFQLGNVSLIARCELHGTVVKRGVKQHMTAFALNEWDSSSSGGIEWRQKIDTQRGAVLATELKNNSFKLAKWTAQSVVAGAEQMKIGFVSRKTRTDRHNHTVMATQFYKPTEFAAQITMSVPHMWGIIKMLADKFLSLDDGKYVIMRDPNKPVARIYSVPLDTFENDDDEEEDEDENEDDDDDGAAEER